MEMLFSILGAGFLLIITVSFTIAGMNCINWLCIKRDELKIRRAHTKFNIQRWKREGRIYEKYLK